MQIQYPAGPSGTLPTAAGGIDFRQAAFSGAGFTGGGFAWASPGSEIDQSGNIQSQFALLTTGATGEVLDVNEEEAGATATVQSGGSGVVGGVIFFDQYGGLYKVATLSGGAAQTVTVITRAWAPAGALPSNPVSVNCWAPIAATACSGVTLNLTWALANSGSPSLGIGTGSATAINIGNSGSTTTFAGTLKLASSTTGSGIQTFTNSPCTGLTTEKWVPVQISGQSGTWYVPACQ
jgi:hypothetical protein